MVSPDPGALSVVQQVPLVNVSKEVFALTAVQHFGQADQNAWVPEPDQRCSAIRQAGIEAFSQPLRKPFEALR